MKNIKLLAEIKFKGEQKSEKNKEVTMLLNHEQQKIIEIKLFNGEVLAKHSSPTSISVLCLSGQGIFKASENLEEEQKLTPGTLIFLEKGILHEVIAIKDLQILVTKFPE